jgi:hypothetical protein
MTSGNKINWMLFATALNPAKKDTIRRGGLVARVPGFISIFIQVNFTTSGRSYHYLGRLTGGGYNEKYGRTSAPSRYQ